jgi:hypothetical protein
MSKRINVNPGQYKVAGRERMGEPMGQEKAREQLAKNRRAKPQGKTDKKR